MANKLKDGLDYFSFDVDFFSDDKIELISAEYGLKGEMIAIRLLCQIYRNSYYYQWGNDEALLFAKRVGNGVTGALVNEVVVGLVKRSFFDKGVFDSFGILTSAGIQKRYIEAAKRRQVVNINPNLCLIDLSIFKGVNINNGNVYINSENDNINSQRKGKEKKGEERKGKEETPPFRDEVLENSILNFFGFNEVANHDKLRLVNAFCFSLKNSGRLENFKIQFEAYCELKNDYGGFKHSFKKFLGDQESKFENGAWNEENWTFRLNEEKEKNSAKKENTSFGQQQPARGVAAAMKFADVKMRD
jgi:hypothetical protein